MYFSLEAPGVSSYFDAGESLPLSSRDIPDDDDDDDDLAVVSRQKRRQNGIRRLLAASSITVICALYLARRSFVRDAGSHAADSRINRRRSPGRLITRDKMKFTRSACAHHCS